MCSTWDISQFIRVGKFTLTYDWLLSDELNRRRRKIRDEARLASVYNQLMPNQLVTHNNMKMDAAGSVVWLQRTNQNKGSIDILLILGRGHWVAQCYINSSPTRPRPLEQKGTLPKKKLIRFDHEIAKNGSRYPLFVQHKDGSCQTEESLALALYWLFVHLSSRKTTTEIQSDTLVM